uniref:Uncharacterized protein n=1 Tax=Strix occidentalis caurina TaxID=311401 RepID=A0A8D0KWB0_STROC
FKIFAHMLFLFWHVSDLHLDPTYHITTDRTKVCSSSKGANASNPGPFGDFLCDSPYQLILSAFAFMKDSNHHSAVKSFNTG